MKKTASRARTCPVGLRGFRSDPVLICLTRALVLVLLAGCGVKNAPIPIMIPDAPEFREAGEPA
ncbi:MAG: hypothetical protein GDA53_02655 [Rhodobacteraceae bacterium]|nr:hypothetical protein [Paracoccaceae bacterium]